MSDQFLEKVREMDFAGQISTFSSGLLSNASAAARQAQESFLKNYPLALQAVKNSLNHLIPKDNEELYRRAAQVCLASGILISLRVLFCGNGSDACRFTDRGELWTPQSSRKKTVRVYFLRHGESKNNARTPGVDRLADPPLTTLGEQQSIAVGHYLSKLASYYSIRNIYISPMLKTLQTAIPLVKSLVADSSGIGGATAATASTGALGESIGGSSSISPADNIVGSTANNVNGTGGPPQQQLSIPCEVRRDLFEYGGIFEGDRRLGDAELAKHPPNFGLSSQQILKNMPGVKCGPGIGPNGWWRGGKETDNEYLARIHGVASWLWRLENNSLIITHGKFLDTLLKVLCEMPDPLEGGSTGKSRSGTVFLHGGCSFSCVEFDHESKKLGVMYVNQPIIAESKLRTGHKIGGFSLKQW